MNDRPIGDHFHLSEFCTSQTATRYGINMVPPDFVVGNLTALVRNILDPLREQLKLPLHISSGYRPPALNSLVHGASRSQHVTGQAADVICPGLAVIDVCQAIIDFGLPFDQLIFEFGAWTHVSYSSTKRRRSILTARRLGQSVTYLEGLPS